MTRKQFILTVIIISCVTLVGLLLWAIARNMVSPETQFEMPLTGIKVSNESLTKRTPFAVVIENSPEARPQSSLSKADLVIETPTEGGITRYLALFQKEEPSEIGPVRSARTYFDDWAFSYNAILVHFGGSPNGLERIRAIGLNNINGLDDSAVFRRDPGRRAPHNAYTSYENIKTEAEKNGFNLSRKPRAYKFKNDVSEEERPDSQEITINFSSGTTYKVTWIYDHNSNSYKRELAGEPHLDMETEEQLTGTNIVIQEISITSNDTTEQHAKNITGKGQATIFLDGKRINGTWRRENQDSIARFSDENEKEIRLNRGQTWIEVISQRDSFEEE